MQTQPSLIEQYQAILQLSKTMLEQANSGDWDSVIDVQIHYIKAVNELTDIESVHDKASLTSTIAPLLSEILDNEMQVKGLLKERMKDLNEKIHYSLHHQQRATHYQQTSMLIS